MLNDLCIWFVEIGSYLLLRMLAAGGLIWVCGVQWSGSSRGQSFSASLTLPLALSTYPFESSSGAHHPTRSPSRLRYPAEQTMCLLLREELFLCEMTAQGTYWACKCSFSQLLGIDGTCIHTI